MKILYEFTVTDEFSRPFDYIMRTAKQSAEEHDSYLFRIAAHDGWPDYILVLDKTVRNNHTLTYHFSIRA